MSGSAGSGSSVVDGSEGRLFRRPSLIRSDSRIGSAVYTRQMSEPQIEQDELAKSLHERYILLKRQILRYQTPVLGLFPSVGKDNSDEAPKVANVRDSIYCAVAAWALSQAYRKIDDDQGRTHELAQSAVKCMRGILFCWLKQASKVEKFKSNQRADNALHSVFNVVTGEPAYKDDEYGHLQIDVVGLYLIYLVQMIKSGIKVIYTTDEVNFIQNLVFYVERAYRTPDYGIWERGSKYNNGSTEVHASSIGFAKAALESINGENMYGEQGASWSVIYVDVDAHNRNRTIFESILPRESNSKNTDASLTCTVGWPAFAIHEEPIKNKTLDKVTRKLKGRYGLKRFLRDGYRTVLEDKNRKYYRSAEIKMFDGIECEWPIFLVYLLIECVFRGDKKGMEHYQKLLNPLLTKTNDGDLLPMLYFVPKENIDLERRCHKGTDRYPSAEGSTDGVFLWGQSIYFISQLLVDGILNVSELDPIRRHLPASERPKVNMRYSSFQITPPDLVVQVALIAESARLQQLLATYGIQTQTPHQIEPIQIWAPRELTKAYTYLGINDKLGLSGRPQRPFGVLSTSKIYRANGQTVLCYPLLFEVSDFYLAQDMSVVLDDLKLNDLAFLTRGWKLAGRPTFCMLIRENNIRGPGFSEFLDLLAQFKRGEVDNVRIRLGKLQSLISSACIEHLDFLDTLQEPIEFKPFEEKTISASFKSLTEIPKLPELHDNGTGMGDQELHYKATWDLVNMLKHLEGPTAHSQILKVLFQREGGHYHIESETLVEKMEKLINSASVYKKWGVVRQMSALLGKLVDSLAPAITTILVKGKQITVGVYGHEEEILDKPISPNELKNILYSKCMPYDIQQAVLQQELILNIGKLIPAVPELFEGILKIRIGWFVHAMRIELDLDNPNYDIYSVSPSDIKQLLLTVLMRNIYDKDFRTPLQLRRLDGALNRVPKDFYDRVWQILEKTPGGIKVAGYLLPQQPTQSDMTMYELNFSLLVEQMLSKIVDPVYRQIMVETFMVVSTLLERNPEVSFQQAVNMDKIIVDAFEDYQKDLSHLQDQEKQDDMLKFFNTPPNIQRGTTSYISKAVIKNLLDGEIHVSSDDMCSVS